VELEVDKERKRNTSLVKDPNEAIQSPNVDDVRVT